MGELTLNTATSSSILTVTPGAMDLAGSTCKDLSSNARVAVITDSNVAPLYAERVTASIAATGLTPHLMVLPAGEEHKTLATVANIYAFLAQNGFTRSDIIAALGGGVVGDISGFTAATYLRGIRSVQIPTTLLAQVDSSVGGKCGVDLPHGKNLVGAFNQPNRVLIDTDVLKTLPDTIFRDGMAEVIKYGCIFDAELFARLETLNVGEMPNEIVERCVELKRDVVERDELDLSERMLLNFGHTVGHAIEKLGSFTRFSHGAAVAIGMICAAKIGEASGHTLPGTAKRITALLSRFDLAAELPYPIEDILSAMSLDKKNICGRLNLILLHSIGKGIICPVNTQQLTALMQGAYPA